MTRTGNDRNPEYLPEPLALTPLRPSSSGAASGRRGSSSPRRTRQRIVLHGAAESSGGGPTAYDVIRAACPSVPPAELKNRLARLLLRGALLVVSHDRQFLARLRLDRALRLDEEGVLRADR